MKNLREIIKELQRVEAKYGNIPVYMDSVFEEGEVKRVKPEDITLHVEKSFYTEQRGEINFLLDGPFVRIGY